MFFVAPITPSVFSFYLLVPLPFSRHRAHPLDLLFVLAPGLNKFNAFSGQVYAIEHLP